MRERVTKAQTAQSKPSWGWSGAVPLDFSRQDTGLRHLVGMLPTKISSDTQIMIFLDDLRARFKRWLHQDEFGPGRRQQTAALRALMKSLQTLRKLITKDSPRLSELIDAKLRELNDPRQSRFARIVRSSR